MNKMMKVLEKTYENEELRKETVPLFIGNPGLGKTVIIEEFAKKKKARLFEFITSQRNPMEISGMMMPDRDTKKVSYWDFDLIENLKDGDIVFFDEVFNGNPTTLNACLTFLESRKTISGKDLPNIMIVAAANPQGMVPLTPQIKERFIYYDVKFNKEMWGNYMKANFKMPKVIIDKLANLIINEKFETENFFTPRSIVKALKQLLIDCPTPYYDHLMPILSKPIENKLETEVVLDNGKIIKPGETMPWFDMVKKF
jgi:hypothetical protein